MFTLNCKGRLLVIDKPLVMGIINTTPDSFFAASRQEHVDEVVRQAEKMLREGAVILDMGGQSTRPGSERVSVEDELARVVVAVETVSKSFPEAFISIDTFYARVAKEAVDAGASIINDISAGSIDDKMVSTAASLGVPYVLMHMKGTPQTMQRSPEYGNVSTEVLDFLAQKKDELHKAGITDIIADPGFGFGKTIEHNFALLRKLEVFGMLGMPLLLGISRKSFIWKTLGLSADEALTGTIALHMAGLLKGASIIRAHDVKEAAETIKLFAALQGK